MTRILSVDGKKIDEVLDEFSKLIIRLEKKATKTRKDENLIKKISEIRDNIQDAIVTAKLKKSLAEDRQSKGGRGSGLSSKNPT
jgi:hypothetical protein